MREAKLHKEVATDALVEVRWAVGTVKRARYVRRTRNGTHVVCLERVDQRGRGLGTYGKPRTIEIAAVIRVLECPHPSTVRVIHGYVLPVEGRKTCTYCGEVVP